MRRILDHDTRTATVDDGEGGRREVEAVSRVSYVDHTGALRELRFEPTGTNVAGEAEVNPRVVGEHEYEDGSTMREFIFTDPEAAVDAYEHGKVV